MKKLSLVQDFGPGEGAQLNELLKADPFGATQTKRIVDAADAMLKNVPTHRYLHTALPVRTRLMYPGSFSNIGGTSSRNTKFIF